MWEEIENTTSLCNNTISELLLLLDVSVLCPGGGGDDAGLSSSVAVPQVTHARHRVAQRLQLPRHQLLNLQWDSCSGAELEGTVISYYWQASSIHETHPTLIGTGVLPGWQLHLLVAVRAPPRGPAAPRLVQGAPGGVAPPQQSGDLHAERKTTSNIYKVRKNKNFIFLCHL